MEHIIAVDPGKTCGVAFFGWSFSSGEHSAQNALALVHYVLAGSGAELVVCESFVPRPGIRTWQPEALETIGALRYICQREGIPFELQAPADAKRFSTNDKLQLLGWRNPTPGGHADDAARHLLLAAVRHGLIDPARFTT